MKDEGSGGRGVARVVALDASHVHRPARPSQRNDNIREKALT